MGPNEYAGKHFAIPRYREKFYFTSRTPRRPNNKPSKSPTSREFHNAKHAVTIEQQNKQTQSSYMAELAHNAIMSRNDYERKTDRSGV